MLRSIFQLDRQLTELLLQMPALVRGFERKSPQTVDALMAWIDRAESLLSNHRLTAAAEVAGYKAKVLAPAFDDAHRGGLRRRQRAAAIGLIHDLQASVQDALRPHAARVEQARSLTRQLLQVVAQSGALKYDPSEAFEDFVDRIWALCLGHEQLKPFAAQLRSLLSADDVRLLLAETLDPADFVGG